jgi:hypothetical protein
MGLFGPSQKEIWEELSKEIQGNFIDGGFWKGSKVKAHVDNWIVLFDTYTTSDGKTSITYTRVRAPFKNLGELYFKIHRKGFFGELGELLGMRDICVGYEQFDDDFVIKGNDEERIIRLFSNKKIRELLELQKSINLEIKDDEGLFSKHFPENVDELYFVVTGVIKDIERLKELYELFAEVLKELCVMGVVSNEYVEVDLKD